MSNCKYCGRPAGFFRFKHIECHEKYKKEQVEIIEKQKQRALEVDNFKSTFVYEMVNGDGVEYLKKRLDDAFTLGYLNKDEQKSLIVAGIEKCINQSLLDEYISDGALNRISLLSDGFGIPLAEVNDNGAVTRLHEAIVIRQVLEGNPPIVDAPLSINFKKGEYAIYVFENVDYLEDRIRRQVIGGSRGVSVRVARGIYYRTGGSRGESVEFNERVSVDSGKLVCTNESLYFIGSIKSTRIPYKKIINFDPYSDGIGIMRDAATAKPQIFVTGNGNFTFSLIRALATIAA